MAFDTMDKEIPVSYNSNRGVVTIFVSKLFQSINCTINCSDWLLIFRILSDPYTKLKIYILKMGNKQKKAAPKLNILKIPIYSVSFNS